MGRHFWGSDGQKQTLLGFKGEYNKHRLAKKTRKFWPRFFSFWFNTYPEDRLIKRVRMTQCKTFMANHTGARDDGVGHIPPADDAPPDNHPDNPPAPPHPPPRPPSATSATGLKSRRERRRLRKSSRDSKILALIRGRSKKYTLPLHQAYSHLYYDKNESIIEAAWRKHVSELRKSNKAYEGMSEKEVAELAKDERLNVVNRELRRLLKSETDDIKREVADYREKHALDDDLTISHAERRAIATKNTAALMKSLLPNLHRETGMTLTVLAAGRSPTNDNIVFRCFHVGKGEFGENFAQWYPNWDTAVKDKYIKFFESVEEATMAASENPPQSIGCGVLVAPRPRDHADTNEDNEDGSAFEEFGGFAEDTEDEAEQAFDMADKPGGKKGRRKVDWQAVFKANRVARQEIDKEMSELEPRSTNTTLPPSLTGSSIHTNREPRSPSTPSPVSPQQESAGREPRSTDPPRPASPGPQRGSDGINLESRSPNHPHPSSPPRESHDTETRLCPPDRSQPASPQRDSLSMSVPNSQPATAVAPDNDRASKPSSLRSVEDSPNSQGQKRKKLLEVDDVDVDVEVPYIVAAIEFLKGVLGGRCPTILIHWAMFEENKNYPESRARKLGSDKLRPKELTELIAHHDYSNISIPPDPVEFGKQWRVWYIDAQPFCRGSSWPLKDIRQLPSTCSWKTLSHGGRNGILVAILGIAIWLLSAKDLKNSAGRKIMQEIEDALKDVDSVLLTMLHEHDKENTSPARGRSIKRSRPSRK